MGRAEQRAVLDRSACARSVVAVGLVKAYYVSKAAFEAGLGLLPQLQAEMSPRGVAPNARTAEQLALPAERRSRLRAAEQQAAAPVIMKPNKGCQGVDISLVRNLAELDSVRSTADGAAAWVARRAPK